jgi:2-keto-3-deoxy-L-rhamnonate aldolase RhmA
MKPSYVNLAKKALLEDRLVLCMGLRQARTADIGAIAQSCGFDSIYVDMEHSSISHETCSALCVAALGQGVTPLVRVPGHLASDMSRALDGGAQGVIVPHTNTADQARAIISACKFPPLGHRSVMGANPALGYQAISLEENNSRLNNDTLVIVMLETPEGIQNAESIAAVPGVDMLLIGSNDLSTELGIPGQVKHPKIFEAYQITAQACRKHGKFLGVGGIRGNLKLQSDLTELGARFIIAGNDVSYLMNAAKQDTQALRQASQLK